MLWKLPTLNTTLVLDNVKKYHLKSNHLTAGGAKRTSFHVLKTMQMNAGKGLSHEYKSDSEAMFWHGLFQSFSQV